MCEGGKESGEMSSYRIIMEIIEQHERNKQRKTTMMKEVQKFMGPNGSGLNGFPRTSLDTKSREEFRPLFD